MEHACYQCGAAVQDGARACSACGAPQIRVAVGEAESSPSSNQFRPATVLRSRIDWHHGLPAAAMAGVTAGVLSALPLLSLGFFIWMLAGGAVAVVLYRRRAGTPVITGGMGARLGAVSGLFGFGSFAVLLSVFLLGRSSEMRELLRRMLEEAASRNPDPQAQQIAQRMMTPEGLALLVTLTLVLFCAAFLILGSLGGALGATMGPREPR
jgi:hypothetical protein